MRVEPHGSNSPRGVACAASCHWRMWPSEHTPLASPPQRMAKVSYQLCMPSAYSLMKIAGSMPASGLVAVACSRTLCLPGARSM